MKALMSDKLKAILKSKKKTDDLYSTIFKANADKAKIARKVFEGQLLTINLIKLIKNSLVYRFLKKSII
jgi:hypothetical protein